MGGVPFHAGPRAGGRSCGTCGWSSKAKRSSLRSAGLNDHLRANPGHEEKRV